LATLPSLLSTVLTGPPAPKFHHLAHSSFIPVISLSPSLLSPLFITILLFDPTNRNVLGVYPYPSNHVLSFPLLDRSCLLQDAQLLLDVLKIKAVKSSDILTAIY
jgi:hypothetical protein